MRLQYLAVAITLSAVGAPAQSMILREDNIPEIVKALTPEEKAMIVTGRNDFTFGGYDNKDEFVRIIDPSVSGYTQGVPRLGIPGTALVDGPAGVVVVDRPDMKKDHYCATGFPVGTLLACSWDTSLVEKIGGAMGDEVLDYNLDVILAPGMNIQRSPLCGRNYEYFSEDPVVTGKIAAAFIRGVQSRGVGACPKHFVANSQETNRTEVNEVVGQRALREIYLKGFEIAVKESDPWTVMASYNRLNGPYTQENRELLTTILRDEWGFGGIVMTDWIQKRHTDAQIKAGIDNLQPGYQNQLEDIAAMLKDGRLSEADLDSAVTRMLRYIVRTPKFRKHAYSNEPDLKGHAQVARDAAAEGMVLLKNEGAALPLEGVSTAALFGLHSYDFLAGGTGSGHVVKPYVVDLRQGLENAGIKSDGNIGRMYSAYKSYHSAKNRCDRDPEERWYHEPQLMEPEISRMCIRNQARNADVAIITLGRQAGEGNDRRIDDDFNLTSAEQKLIRDVCDAFHQQNKKVIVIINAGGPIETASWKALPDAVLVAWQPGQEGGNAVADVLLGKVCPSGKLAMTFPVSAYDVPSTANYPLGNDSGRGWGERRNIDYTLHEEGINVGYRHFVTSGKTVSYPFGYGMSYTTFEYSRPEVKAVGDGFQAKITVKNTGKTAGKESVQLYVTAPDGKLAKPSMELKAFAKTRLLQPGESETLVMNVSNYGLASFDESVSAWVADPGRYTVRFGASSEDIRATAAYTLRHALEWKVNDVLRPDRELSER